MKRIIKIVFLSLVSLFIIVVIGLFIFLKTFDFTRFKPQIIAAWQNAFGRSIDFARINLGLSLKNGIQLRLADLAVGEHPDFGKEDFLSTKEVNLGVSIKDLILKRQIRVLGIECKAPRLNIIRLKDGRINVQAFPTVGQSAPQISDALAQKSAGKNVPQAAMALPAVFINRMNIDNGRLVYEDYSFSPKISLVFDRIALKIENFSLTELFPITLSASFASQCRNIVAQGKGRINMTSPSFMLKDVKASADLSGLSMDDLRRFIPQLEGVPLPEVKSGVLSASVGLFEAGPQGLIVLKGEGALAKGSLKMKELAVPIAPIEAKFTLSESAVTLDNASFGFGKGKVELSGAISDYLLKQKYYLKTVLKGMDFNECLDQSAYPVKIKGLAFGNFELKGQGFDPHTALSNLSGSGSVEIKKGQLIDMNILKMVLDKFSFIPNLSAALEAGLPGRFKEILRKKDTDIASFKTVVGIGDSKILIRQMDMEAESFLFHGNGSVGFDQSYSFDGSFMIPQDLSARMTAAVPEMEYLLDDARQIRFPLKVSGKGVSVFFMPDVKQIAIGAIKQKGRQELKKVLDKVFGAEPSAGDGVQDSPDKTGQDSDSPEKKSRTQQLIDSVIGTIFRE